MDSSTEAMRAYIDVKAPGAVLILRKRDGDEDEIRLWPIPDATKLSQILDIPDGYIISSIIGQQSAPERPTRVESARYGFNLLQLLRGRMFSLLTDKFD